MVFKFEIFNHSEFRIHKAYIVSKATFFNTLIIFFTFLLPFLLINASRDFWITEISRFHNPNVRFKDQLILKVVYGKSIKMWSTIPSLRQKYVNSGVFVNCKMSYQELTSFTSGTVIGERLDQGINVDVRIPATDSIYGVQVLMVLDYQVADQFTLKTEAVVALDNIYAVPGIRMTVFGDLEMYQKFSMPFGSHYTENFTMFGSGQNVSETRLDLLMQQYMQRNFTSTVNDETKVFSWTPITPGYVNQITTFDLKMRIRYKAQSFRYKAAFWYTLKFAWLQYVAILFVFYLFFSRVRFYLFSNRLLSTTVSHPEPIKHSRT